MPDLDPLAGELHDLARRINHRLQPQTCATCLFRGRSGLACNAGVSVGSLRPLDTFGCRLYHWDNALVDDAERTRVGTHVLAQRPLERFRP